MKRFELNFIFGPYKMPKIQKSTNTNHNPKKMRTMQNKADYGANL